MSGFYTEADYENSIIELFQNIGYRHVYGPDVERDFYSPLYEEELNAALRRLNPTMPEDAIADALFKLKNFENAELVQKNAVFMDYIQHGIEVRYFVKGEERSGLVYLVDYKNPDNNSFIVANQWTFIENSNKRPDVLETYAYELLHPTKDGEEFFKMKFDVIIGNPPYQLSDGGGDGSSAQPIYQKFVQQAKKLNPQYLSMIIPARWYSGGKGLDEFRAEMLNDERLEVIHDFPETADCFPGINIRGGICYFLWSKAHKGDCLIVNHKQNDSSEMRRPLLEKGADTFIRYNAAVSILSKVMAFHEETMDNRVSSRLPFGIPSNFTDYTLLPDAKHCVTLYRSERSKNADRRVYVAPIHITKNYEWKDSMKVLVSKASPGGDEYPHAIISAPVLADVNSVCTETYLIVDFVKSEAEGNNLISYMRTRFFRFMMSLIKNTQNISKGVFAFVPVQDWSKSWTDEELYAKYDITEEEIAFIESMIRPMEGNE